MKFQEEKSLCLKEKANLYDLKKSRILYLLKIFEGSYFFEYEHKIRR